METISTGNKISYLSFRIENETFAIDVTHVLEVLQYQRITRVPKSAGYIRGVINFRGEILPVIDTRIKFGLGRTKNVEQCVIIVLDLEIVGKKIILGAIVDLVKDVFEISPAQISEVPQFGSTYNVEFLTGMFKAGETFIMILDAHKVFAFDDVITIK